MASYSQLLNAQAELEREATELAALPSPDPIRVAANVAKRERLYELLARRDANGRVSLRR